MANVITKFFPRIFSGKKQTPDTFERTPMVMAKTMSAFMKSVPNPDKVKLYRSNGEGYQLYLDMPKKDPDLSGMIRDRALTVASKSWEIQPYDDSPEAQEIAEFCNEVFDRIPGFTDIRQKMAKTFWMGFSVAEIIWQITENGYVTIADIRDRHQNRFQFGLQGQLQYKVSPNSMEYKDAEDMKFIVLKFCTDGENPYGTPVAQSCYLYWWGKLDAGVKNWFIAAEKFAMPTIHGKHGKGMTETEKDAFKDALDTLMSDAAISTSDDVEIKLLEAMRQMSGEYKTLCERMDSSMARGILGQTLTSAEGKNGTQALGTVHADVRDDIIQGDAEAVMGGLQQALEWLVMFNFPNAQGFPTFVIKYEPEKDRKADAEVIKMYVDMGLEVGEEYAYEVSTIPRPKKGEKVLVKSSPILNDPNNPNDPSTNPGKDAPDSKLSFSANVSDVVSIVSKLVDASREKNSLIMATSGERITTLAQKPTSEAADDLGESEIHNSDAIVRLAAENPESYLPGLPPVKEPVEGEPVAKQPDASAKRYQLDAIATYQNRSRAELRRIYNGFVRSILSEFGQLPGEASAAAQMENMMAVIDDFIASEFRSKLQGGVSRANRTLIRQAARDIASKLGTSFNVSTYESMVSSYLRVHAFERMTPNSLSPVIESMIDDTRRRFSEKVSQSITSGGDLNDSITFLKTELNGIADYKATQIAVTETRAAANWSVLESGIRSGLDLEAWFIVDPESCPLCQEQASRNPFNMRQAQSMLIPHPNCNDMWMLTKRGAA